jgi:hypothetical protein
MNGEEHDSDTVDEQDDRGGGDESHTNLLHVRLIGY